MRRCVVNVGTKGYKNGTARLGEHLTRFGNCDYLSWTEIPSSWPKHEDIPYGFKAYALEEARKQGYELVLWSDSAVIPIRSMEPLWEKIEREGYWLAINGWTNYEWTADSSYPDLFPGMKLEQARELNKRFTQIVATCFGLNLKHTTGATFLRQYYQLAQTKAFCGPWGNTASEHGPKYHESMMGECGPPDVLGHRHDQTAASVIAWRVGCHLTQCPEIFAYKNPPNEPDPRTIMLAVGA